jgi:hypothetical protein
MLGSDAWFDDTRLLRRPAVVVAALATRRALDAPHVELAGQSPIVPSPGIRARTLVLAISEILV